jgi:hypothetical protein
MYNSTDTCTQLPDHPSALSCPPSFSATYNGSLGSVTCGTVDVTVTE